MFTFILCDASFKCTRESIYLACRITGITKFLFHNPHLHVHFVLRKLTQLFLFYSLICPSSTHTLSLSFPCSPSPKIVTLTLSSHTGNGILASQSQRMRQKEEWEADRQALCCFPSVDLLDPRRSPPSASLDQSKQKPQMGRGSWPSPPSLIASE